MEFFKKQARPIFAVLSLATLAAAPALALESPAAHAALSSPAGLTQAARPMVTKSGTSPAQQGASTEVVRNIQNNLIKTHFLAKGYATGYYGDLTKAAVKKFQAHQHQAVTGVLTQGQYEALKNLARKTPAVKPTSAPASKGLDPRCMTGRAVCINKSTHKLSWVVNGKVLDTFSVRTGRPGYATRDGLWHISSKYKNWRSTIYHVDMPYSQFFSGGEAIHYSADYAANGYGVGSHGCANLRDWHGAAWLFAQTRIGDKVVVTEK